MGYRKPYVPKRRGARSGALRSPKSNHVAEGPLVKAPDLGGLPAIVVNPGESRTPRVRPVWIYDSMVLDESAAIANPDADTVAVLDPRGRFLGSAVYNNTSKIRARIFSLVPQRFDEKYLAEAIRAAVGRRAVLPDVAESCRLIYADSDGLPGIVADRLGPFVSLQLMTLSLIHI